MSNDVSATNKPNNVRMQLESVILITIEMAVMQQSFLRYTVMKILYEEIFDKLCLRQQRGTIL
jgi:hypothetical protein